MLCGWPTSQMFQVNNFEWTKILLNLMKILLKAITKKVIKDIFEIDVHYIDKLHDLQNDLLERMKIEKVEKLVANLHDKS